MKGIAVIPVFMLVSPFLLFVFHAITVRAAARFKSEVSGQKLLVLCIAASNVPVLALSGMFLGAGISFVSLAYVFVTFNLFAYLYFHFFNMSETARRIKILTGVNNGSIRKISDISVYYDYEKTLEVRLSRLVQLGQISKDGNGRYSLIGKTLFVAANIVWMFRKMLGFERHNAPVKTL